MRRLTLKWHSQDQYALTGWEGVRLNTIPNLSLHAIFVRRKIIRRDPENAPQVAGNAVLTRLPRPCTVRGCFTWNRIRGKMGTLLDAGRDWL